MAADITSRLAGRALLDFFKEGSKAVSSYAAAKTLDYLTDKADAPGIFGKIASRPEAVSKLAGMVAPVAAAGGIAGTLALGKKLLGGGGSGAPGGSRVSFANQQYMPGISPMTNQAVASSMLAEQRFNQQMQLLQARQNAFSGRGSLQQASTNVDVTELLSKIYGY